MKDNISENEIDPKPHDFFMPSFMNFWLTFFKEGGRVWGISPNYVDVTSIPIPKTNLSLQEW
jgi:hypothetical protein